MMTNPLFSVIVPIWHPDPGQLREAIQSVIGQGETSWQLILVLDGSQADVIEAIVDEFENRSSQIRVHRRTQQGGIVAATNDGLSLATGEFVTFLDNDDVLASHALRTFRHAVEASEDVDVVYSDEDKLNRDGRRVDPFHKPAWSPERLRGQMYLGHLCAYRRSLVEEVGNLRPGFDGAQDHDLALRVTERARRVTHVPQVLYHWRQSSTSTAADPANKDWAFEAGVRAVQSQLDRLGIPALAQRDHARVGVVSISPSFRHFPLVSIIMLTGGTRRIVRGEDLVLPTNAIESLIQNSTYPNFEILVVVDRTSTPELVEDIRQAGQGRVRVVQDTRPFSFSDSNNLGASHAAGDHLIFLNDDTEVITPDWIERMVLWSSLEGVGAVGCCLEYPDGRIQHAGVFSRLGGPSHRYHGYHSTIGGSFNALGLTMNCSIVTAACLTIRREVFDEIGGFCTHLPLNFNDVDLCLKLINAGYRNVLDNRTRLVHLETSSRPKGIEAWEHEFILQRWNTLLHEDPWDNPNLVGVAVEEIPPPAALTARKELSGGASYPNRSWPDFVQS